MKQFIALFISTLLAVQVNAQVSAGKLLKMQKAESIAEKELIELIERSSVAASQVQPNYFQKFRMELNKLAAEEQAKAAKHGVLVHSLMKLPADTAGFFIATGAVNFMTMWATAGGNPIAFQQQVEGLTDPVANFSFYMFMVANGVYVNFASKDLSPEAKALAARRMNYMGMAMGSFVSSLAADVGTSLTACANSWLTKDNSVMKKDKTDSELACEQANQIWTTRKLTNKYIPQIYALLIVQAGTEIIQAGVEKGTVLLAKNLLKAIISGGKKMGLEMLFVNVALSANPSRLAIRSISIIGKITQFTFFVAVDHVLNNTLVRGWNNWYKPVIFKNTAQFHLDGYFELAGKYKWNEEKIKNIPFPFLNWNVPNGATDVENYSDNFSNEITNFTEQLTEWRDHLNSNAEQELSTWLSETNRIINQIQISEKFYKDYIANLFTTSNIACRISLPATDSQKLTEKAYNNVTQYPYRPLPLFGVRYIPWADSNIAEKDAYITQPALTEKMQSEFLGGLADLFLDGKRPPNTLRINLPAAPTIKSYNLSKTSEQLVVDTLKALQTRDPMTQGKALKVFMARASENIYLENRYAQAKTNNIDYGFKIFADHFIELIGKASPKLNIGEGFPAAFALENKTQLETADFDTSDNDLKVNFTNATDYLMHAMVCGPEVGKIKEYGFESNFIFNNKIQTWSPDFFAPAIVHSAPQEICAQTGGRASPYNFYSQPLTNSVNGMKTRNLTDYITKNIKLEVMGDYRDEKKTVNFSKWWSAKVMTHMPAVLKEWDKRYIGLVNSTMNNIFTDKTSANAVISGNNKFINGLDIATQFNWFNTNLLGSNLVDTYRFEKEFYLQTINLVKTKAEFDLPASKKTSILGESQKIAKGLKSSVLKPLTSSDYVAVSTALEALIAELAKPVTYLNYEDQVKTDEQIAAESNFKRLKENKIEPKHEQLDYKRYVELAKIYNDAITKIESNSGLVTVETNIFTNTDERKETQIEHPSIEQKIVKASAAGLRSIEANISKYVRMKVLMRRGLSFTKEEVAASPKSNCTKMPNGQCK